jgi:hypothetical protein
LEQQFQQPKWKIENYFGGVRYNQSFAIPVSFVAVAPSFYNAL